MLIGREEELAELVALIAQPCPVAIWGAAGSGKTALVNAAAEASGRRRFLGGGLAQLRWEPYLPLMRALGVRVRGGDRSAVAEFVTTLVGDGVLVIDDLHCIDTETLAVLPLIAAQTALLCTIRAGEPLSATVARACETGGIEVRDLGPLADEPARALLRVRNPRLDDEDVNRIVAAAGGNPLFLDQLALTGTVTATLARAIDARLESRSPQARAALATLALRGQPCERAALGEDATRELLAADLVLDIPGGRVALRQRAVGDRAVDALDPGGRRRLHERLAAALPDPGERARHEVAAGLRDRARESALDAAAAAGIPPLERATHLVLAAACSEAAEAPARILDAAEAMLGAGEAAKALALAESATASTPHAARGRLVLARSALAVGDPARAARAAAEGLGLVDPAGSDALALRIELLRADGGALAPATRLAEARACVEAAERLAEDVAPALLTLGAVQLQLGRPEWRATLTGAVAAARAGGDRQTEMLAAQALVVGALGLGGDGALPSLVREFEQRAGTLLLRAWQLQFTTARLWLEVTVEGRLAEAERECRALLGAEVAASWRDQLEAVLALALADRGEQSLEAARKRLDAALARAPTAGRPLLEWVDAEVAWLAGNPGALERALWCLRRHGELEPVGALAAVTASWSRHESGRAGDADEDDDLIARQPLDYGGTRSEREAVLALGGSTPAPAFDDAAQAFDGAAQAFDGAAQAFDGAAQAFDGAAQAFDGAAQAFDGAARAWREVQLRGELRCAWGRAEALRRSGELDAARDALEQLAARAAATELRALDARIGRSARESGARGVFARSADDRGLTATERAVMSLAAGGMTNVEVGAFLKISAATVETHLDHVKEKLGAATRKEAVAAFLRAPHTPHTPHTPHARDAVPGARQRERRPEDETPPIVVLEDARALSDLRPALSGEGWTVSDGFPPLEDAWRLASPRVVFVGRVDGAADREAALRAGARGAGLVILEPPPDHGFAEDLGRLGNVAVYAAGELTPRMRMLLRAQSQGRSIKDAARELHLSDAGAYRAMREARSLLGAASNTEAVAKFELRYGSQS